jgi:hypothetical protein
VSREGIERGPYQIKTRREGESSADFDLAAGGGKLGGVPALLRVGGYRFFFFSMEGREPPHIHVAHAGRYAKFWLEPVSVADVRGFRGHEYFGGKR